MIDNSEIETYIYLSNQSLTIVVLKIDTSEPIYYHNFPTKNSQNKIDISDLEKFLELNIFEIEKKLDNFINQIFLIIESDSFHTVNISTKKNNLKKKVSKKDIAYMLTDIKREIIKNNPESSIIHVIIKSFIYDDKSSSSLNDNEICDNFCLNIDFICLKKNFLDKFSSSFKKYQITIDRVIDGNYVKKFLTTYGGLEVCQFAQKIQKGFNANEVQFAPRIKEKKGFFEKFFNFFK